MTFRTMHSSELCSLECIAWVHGVTSDCDTSDAESGDTKTGDNGTKQNIAF